MKKTIWMGLSIVLAITVAILGVLCGVLYQRLQTNDFSLLYVEPVQGILEMIDHDAAFDTYRQSGVLYLDTDGLTQTASDGLVDQMAFYAKREGLSLASCGRDDAVQKGYLQQDGDGYKAKDSVWVMVSDRRVDETTVQASICLYAGGRAAYFADVTLTQQDGRWLISDLGGGIA